MAQNGITYEQIQDWFNVKKEIKKIEIQGSATGGLGIVMKEKARPEGAISRQMKFAAEHPQDYVQEYLQREEESYEHERRRRVSETFADEIDTVSVSCGLNYIHPEEDKLTEVYDNYNFEQKCESNLLISNYKDDIINAIESQQVIIIEGATGSGKTTQVPQFILDHYVEKNMHCNIIVTQPRRIAAISIARRVCRERNWELGKLVGYQVGLNKNTTSDTRLTYVTTGVLLQRLINKKNMNDFTHVILDEVHERDQDMDFCLLIVKKFLKTVSRHVKVILMSATFDVSLFGNYFATAINNRMEPAITISMEGKSYDVSEYYIHELAPLGPLPVIEQNEPCIQDESYAIAHKLIQRFDIMEARERPEHDICPAPRKSVLIFLPGLEEIREMYRRLDADSTKCKWELLPLHSTITTEEQELVFKVPNPGYRKIILATNIAESSITVPDVKYVIDFCLTKNLVCDPETNYTSLRLEWASKANCKQRRGRTGRVECGRLYRMIPIGFYDNVLPEYNIAEMMRCPLEQIILKVKVLDIGEPKAILALALEPPNLPDIQRTIRILKEVGALTLMIDGVFNPDDGDLTFMGQVLAKLPLDIHIGKLIVLGFVFGCLEDAIIIAAGLSLQTIFMKLLREELGSYKAKLQWSKGSLSDCFAILHAYTTWKSYRQNRRFDKPNGMNEHQWCRENYLQFKRLRNLEELVMELTKRLEVLNIRRPMHETKVISDDQKVFILKLAICGAFYPNYFLSGENDEEVVDRTLSGKDPKSTILLGGLPLNHGVLYDNELKLKLRPLGEVNIYYEDSKAYVEFIRSRILESEYMNSVGPLKILPNVYYAVKWRLLRQFVDIKVLQPEEAERRLSELEKLQNGRESHGRIRRNRMSMCSFSTIQIPEPKLPSWTEADLFLYVTHIDHCGQFWVRRADDEVFTQVTYLQNIIEKQNAAGKLEPVLGSVVPGTAVLAPYEDECGLCYYRARVVFVHGADVEVHFVDFGNSDTMNRSHLRQIDHEHFPVLVETPGLAFECYLSEIRPSTKMCSAGVWTKEANEYFSKHCLNKKLRALIYSVVQRKVALELILTNVTGQQRNFNEFLKDKRFADAAEEPSQSRSNHATRRELQAANSDTAFYDHSNDVNVVFMNTASFSRSGPDAYSNQKIKLRGPSSPLEVSFYNITQTGSTKQVRIEPDSVNCVVLNSEPQDKHSRLLVAHSVGLNPSGTAFVARGTTLMPLIHGLPSLIALLFAPYAELRADRAMTSYIGALCGLGCNEDSGFPLYPEHDMEISFDVEIDEEDLILINTIRLTICKALQSTSGIHNYSEKIFRDKFQIPVCDKLLSLFSRHRDSVEMRSFSKPYKWKQVPEDRILKPSTNEINMEPLLAQSLHSAISLNLDHLREHVTDLHGRASSSRESEDIPCKLCRITVKTPQELMYHLASIEHVNKEKVLFE